MEQKVTALFGVSDLMTGGIYDYLYEKGISIGEDVSVVGFDNESISAFFRPQLTTTALPLREIGKKSAELLLEKLENANGDLLELEYEAKPQVYKIPCEMVVRQSVCKAK